MTSPGLSPIWRCSRPWSAARLLGRMQMSCMGMKEGGGAFPPARPDRFHIQPAPGWARGAVGAAAVVCDGPIPCTPGLVERLSSTARAHSRLAVAFLLGSRGTRRGNRPHRLCLVRSPGKTRRRKRAIPNPLLLSRSSIHKHGGPLPQRDQQDKRGAHTRGMHERSETALWSGAPLMVARPCTPHGRVMAPPSRALKHRLLVREPQGARPEGLSGRRRQAEGHTRGASLPRGFGWAGKEDVLAA